MASSDLKLSDTSYTNKEFQEIYPELLDKAKELSYKWDPTVSNESDPGVTLIKEIAIALDKINYASDKNAMETMPLSVTQERTARQLFQLLGYYPKWYISAEANVSMAWKISQDSEDYESLVNSGEMVKIPAFTEIRDDSGDYVYTIPTTTFLKSNGSVEVVKAIQGVVKDLKINNTTIITLDLINQNNRVYFPDYNVAQNGIFVMNKDAAESGEVNERSFWEQKDNLYVEEPGNRYYSFNIDIPTNRCYIEFPADISDLIAGGLVIKYLVTTGRDGNSAVGQLNQLYDSSISASYVLNPDTSITMDSDNLYIQNTSLEVTGKDPETIDDMYRNYNRIKGTFDTIVTLRDYNNAVYNTGEVSNAVVTDRTNDQQQAYRIMASTLDESENVVYMPQSGSIEEYAEDRLHPFALKVYAFQYAEISDSASESENKKAYDTTFTMYVDRDVENPFNIDSTLLQLTQLLNDERCIQHDFSDIQSNKICLLKNIAEINLMVFPNVKLTELQKQNVIDSIKNQIYKKYNSREREFGQGVDYDTLFTDILTSDALIKNVSLNQVQYYTYAIYYSEGEGSGVEDGWKEVCVSDEYDYINLAQQNAGEFVIQGQNTEPGEKGSNVFFIYGDDSGSPMVYVTDENKKLVPYSKMRQVFRNEILAKNILAGVTPLFITGQKHKFNYAADEDNSAYFPAVSDVDMYTQMEFSFEDGQSASRYYPKENEVIQFVRPQLTQSISYGSYVRYDWTGRTVPANQNHQMIGDETLVFYYKTEDSDESPYTRVAYGQESGSFPIISPTFQLERTTRHAEKLSDPRMVPTSAVTIRSGQSLSIKEKNEVKLDKNNYIYVVGDEIEHDNENYYQIALQKDYVDEENKTHYSVTLQNEQQLIYAQDSLAYLNIVGSGTKVSIITSANDDSLGDVYYFENKVVSLSKISRFGVSALQGYWKKISQTLPGCQVVVLAQEFVNVQGSVTGDEANKSTDSYVEISSNAGMPSGVSMVLDRDGLKYSMQDNNTSYIRSAKGTLAYLDSNNQNQYTDIASSQINTDNLFEFLNGAYGWENDDETSTVTFIPKDYITTSLTVAQNQEQTQVSGIKTKGFEVDGESYYFLISNSVLYRIHETDDGPLCTQIEGFCTGGQLTEYDIKPDPENPGSYILSDASIKLEAHKSIILLDVSDQDNKFYIPGQSLQTNESDTEQDIQPFNIPILVTTQGGVVSNVKAIIAYFWKIEKIELDYMSSLPGIRPVHTSLDASDDSTVEIQPLDGYVVITCNNIGYNSSVKRAVRLTNTTSTFRNDGDDYDKCIRYWEYTNNDGLTDVISSSDLKDIYDFYSSDLPSNFDQWQWPIDGAAIQIIASQDKVGTDDPVNPSLYSFTYKNRGGEEERLVLDDQSDIGWSIYGLAYLDSSNTSPQRIYENQVLTVYAEDEDPFLIVKEADRDTYVYTSDELYVEGYKKQNLQMLDKNGKLYYPSLLASKVVQSDDYSRDIEDKVLHITKDIGTPYQFDYTDLPSGEYVFKIVNRFNIDKLRFRVPDDGSVKCLNLEDFSYDTVYDMYQKGVYYYQVKVDGQLHLSMHPYASGDQVIDVLIYPMKPIEHPDDSPFKDPMITDNVLSLIKQLATYNDRDMFNYLYEPKEDKMIINPLKSESFNNVNHFYNHCTICKVRTYDVLGDSNIFISQ